MPDSSTTLHLPALPGWLKSSIGPALLVLLVAGVTTWIQAQTQPQIDSAVSDVEETLESEAATLHERIADVQDEVDALTDSDTILRDRIAANRETATMAVQEAGNTREHVTEISKMAAEQRQMMIEMQKDMRDEIRATNMMIQGIQDRL